jgi:UPF0271 protein
MEVYVDMDYAPDGAIVIQREKHSTDVEKAAAQIRRFLEQGVVLATDGSLLPLEAESICVHGDGPNALEVIQALRRTIEACGHAVAALAGAASAR